MTFLMYALSLTICLTVAALINLVVIRYPEILKRRWQTDCLDYLKQPPLATKQKLSLLKPRLQCGHCHKTLPAWQLIPILSYFLLKRQCYFCRHKLSVFYPIIGLLSLCIGLSSLYLFSNTLLALLIAVYGWILLTLAIIDWQERILPDDLTLSLLWIGLLVNAASMITSAEDAILGAVSAYLFLWGINTLFRFIRKKNGMGHGDFKLFAALGAWQGLSGLVNTLLIAVICALLVSAILFLTKKFDPNKVIPFGPYLAIGGWLSLIMTWGIG